MAKDMTREQYKEIRKLTRRAQRRMERATPGQRRAMEYNVEKATGSKTWSSAAKGFTYQQAQAQIEKLNRFLAGETTLRRGWERLKQWVVEKARKTLQGRYRGFNLTDEELADVFEQVGDASRSDKYKAINLVQAAKTEAGGVEIGDEAIAKAISEKVSAETAYRRALKARKQNLAQEDEDFDIPF